MAIFNVLDSERLCRLVFSYIQATLDQLTWKKL